MIHMMTTIILMVQAAVHHIVREVVLIINRQVHHHVDILPVQKMDHFTVWAKIIHAITKLIVHMTCIVHSVIEVF